MSDQNRKESQPEIVIQLTAEQRDQIQKVTGKLVTELKVGTVEDRANPGAIIHQ